MFSFFDDDIIIFLLGGDLWILLKTYVNIYGFAGSPNLVISFPPGDRGKQLFKKHGML